MIQLKTFLKVIDNSGALIAECINVMGGSKCAHLGDEIKKARPQSSSAAGNNTTLVKCKTGDVLRALVVRVKSNTRRLDGSYIKFEDNACVILNKGGVPVGNRVVGPIAEECRQKRWAKVVAISSRLV